MIRSRFIVLMALTMVASTGAQSSPVLSEPQTATAQRKLVALKAEGALPERSLSYLAPVTATAVAARSEEQSVQASPAESGDKNNAPAVFAVGLMIAAFTILRRLN